METSRLPFHHFFDLVNLLQTHIGDALGLHEAVVQRAKELFAGFRDDRELVQQFKGVLAGCLCEAFDQLSRDGRQILKMRAGEEDNDVTPNESTAEGKKKPSGKNFSGNARASKRQELHSATLAGKGGIFITTPSKGKDESSKSGEAKGGSSGSPSSAAPASTSAVEMKPAPSWDMDDCRSWLLDASRSIARQWVDARRTGETTGTAAKIAGPIPDGSLDELEGKLVEHTFSICEMLENDMKIGGSGIKKGGGPMRMTRKVVTPRIQDMGTLGIKWQHAHERGSGGKGGVGNNAQSIGAQKAKMRQLGRNRPMNNRTVGQIIILKSAKTLGAAIKDPVSGDAFHKELRALLQRQEARKQKGLRNDAAQQRFNQMKRKPWLQAKLEKEEAEGTEE